MEVGRSPGYRNHSGPSAGSFYFSKMGLCARESAEGSASGPLTPAAKAAWELERALEVGRERRCEGALVGGPEGEEPSLSFWRHLLTRD